MTDNLEYEKVCEVCPRPKTRCIYSYEHNHCPLYQHNKDLVNQAKRYRDSLLTALKRIVELENRVRELEELIKNPVFTADHQIGETVFIKEEDTP